MSVFRPISLGVTACAAFLMMVTMSVADIARFVGDYEGMAQILRADGSAQARNMSVTIGETSEGFSVNWTSGTRRADGSLKTKSYEIDFKPSAREGIFAAAQKKNIFGHAVQLDPMKGEPYVWAQIIGDTLTVYSLYVTDDGGYEMQQYDRTIAEGGLNLNFQIIKNGEPLRSVSTFLVKQ